MISGAGDSSGTNFKPVSPSWLGACLVNRRTEVRILSPAPSFTCRRIEGLPVCRAYPGTIIVCGLSLIDLDARATWTVGGHPRNASRRSAPFRGFLKCVREPSTRCIIVAASSPGLGGHQLRRQALRTLARPPKGKYGFKRRSCWPGRNKMLPDSYRLICGFVGFSAERMPNKPEQI